MSDRPLIKPTLVITSGDMSGNLTSRVTILERVSMMSYAYSWSGSTPIGTVSVQVSNDYSENPDGSVKTAGTWNSLVLGYNGTQASTIPVTGNTGNGFIDIDSQAGYAIRTIYTAASGTGTLNVTVKGKVA